MMTKQDKQSGANKPTAVELTEAELEAAAGGGQTGGTRLAAGGVNGGTRAPDDGSIPTETLSLNFDKIT